MLLINQHPLSALPLNYVGAQGGTIGRGATPGRTGDRFAQSMGWAGLSNKAGVPNGHLAPSSWTLPIKAGGMSSYTDARIVFSESLSMSMGMALVGTDAIEFSESGTLQAIVNLIGSDTITFTDSASILAVVSLTGSDTFTFSESAQTFAVAFLSGSDTFTFTEGLITHANAFLVSAPDAAPVLTPDAIADAVWAALAASHGAPGTMGERLTSAEKWAKISAALSA